MAGRDFTTNLDEKDVQILSREDLETEIRRRTAYLENVMDTMVDLLLRLDTEGQIDMCNRAVTDILGYDPEDIKGKPVDILFADLEGDEELSDMLSQGELFDRLFNQGHVTDVDVSFETNEGNAIPMSLSASIITDGDKPEGIVCVAKDISERKEAQGRAEFLHSLLRHDLSNKLQVISAHLVLLGDYELPEKADFHLEKGTKGLDEAMELIENVRTLSSIPGEPDPTPVDLTHVLHNCIERYDNRQLDEGVEMDIQVGEGIEVLAGAILNELIDNLLENAFKHSKADCIRVKTTERSDQVVVTIEDNGVGIPDDLKRRILQKGEKGRESTGSGLGLHLSKEIARGYDGNLELKDSEMGGARFDITLKRAFHSEKAE